MFLIGVPFSAVGAKLALPHFVIATLVARISLAASVKSVYPHVGHSQSFLEHNEIESSMTASSLVQWLRVHGSSFEQFPDDDYLQRNAEFALRARSEISPARSVSQDLFLREVLPYRHLDEPIDEWRPWLFERLLPVTNGKQSLKEIAEAVIPHIFNNLDQKIEFRANSTPAVMAPLSETLAKGGASCTGLSIFVACALRSVGVPARVVGTPEWNLTTGGNHNWIEVWHGDAWHYTDAAPIGPNDHVEWDKAWFTQTNSQLAIPGTIHGIYTPVWDKADSNGIYNLTWRDPYVQFSALDRTLAYKNLNHSVWNPAWEKYRIASESLR